MKPTMKTSTCSLNRKSGQYRGKLAIAVTLSPLLWTFWTDLSLAEQLRGRSAVVDSVNGTAWYQRRRAIAGDRIYGAGRRLMVSGGGRAGLGFISNRETRIGAKNLFTAIGGPTTYFYPCGSSGTFTIGWIGGAGCPTWVLKGSQLVRKAEGKVEQFQIANLQPPLESVDRAKGLSKAAGFKEGISYCSAVASSGRGWGASISGSSWDILSPTDPCEQAIRICENNANGSCVVANMGDQIITEPDQSTTATLKCGVERVISERSEPALLNEWLLTQSGNGLRAETCILSLLNQGDRLIFPVTNSPTVVTTSLDQNGNPTLIVLAGSVRVVEANPRIQPVTVFAGQICASNERSFQQEPSSPYQQKELPRLPTTRNDATTQSDTAIKTYLNGGLGKQEQPTETSPSPLGILRTIWNLIPPRKQPSRTTPSKPSQPQQNQTSPQPAPEVVGCPTTLPELAKQEIFRSTPVQSFFAVKPSVATNSSQTETWSAYLEPDIAQYRNAVNDQFLNSARATYPQ